MPRSYGITNAAPYASAPAVGAAGDTYFNTTGKILSVSDGTSWIATTGAVSYDGFTRYGGTGGAQDTTGVLNAGNTDIPLPIVGESQGVTYTANGTNTRFTIPASGVYDITAHVATNVTPWPTNAGTSGFPWVGIAINGLVLARQHGQGGVPYESIVVSEQRYLSAGDQVGIVVFAYAPSQYRILNPAGANDGRQPHLSVWRAGAGPPGPVGTGVTLLTTAQRNALSGGNLYRGLTIFNTDTGGIEVYYGATTGWRPPWNTSWGVQGTPVARTTAQTGISAEVDLTGMTVTWTALAGRYYTANASLRMTSSTVSTIGGLYLADSANTHIDEESYAIAAANATTQYMIQAGGLTGLAGSITYKLRAASLGGGTIDTLPAAVRPARFWVEDIGPNGNAPAS